MPLLAALTLTLSGCYATGTTDGRSQLAQADMRAVTNGTAVASIRPRFYLTAYVAAIDANGRAYRETNPVHIFISEQDMALYVLGGGPFSSRGEQIGPTIALTSISNTKDATIGPWQGVTFLTNASGTMTEKLFIAPTRAIYELDASLNIGREAAVRDTATSFLKSLFEGARVEQKSGLNSAGGAPTLEAKLTSLKRLLDQGLINQEEFDREKTKLLEELRLRQ